MKPTMALKPLVFALAAVMAMAAQADKKHDNHHGPKAPDWVQLGAGATAAVVDKQDSHGNLVINQGTRNNASSTSSMNNSSGNMGSNIAAGDGNQQDNAVALATADEDFVFGSANATSSATQYNNNNKVANFSTKNNASLTDSGNRTSGNVGINVAAGNFNQQKNNLAIAVSGGRVATAAASANQTSSGLLVTNAADPNMKKVTLKDTFHAGGYVYLEGEGETKGGKDHKGHPQKGDKFEFEAVGVFGLAGVTTHQVLVQDGWKNPVVNNASLTNSLNGTSGNVGSNVAAGVGNQQSNSLSIAAGCRACM